MIRRIGSPPTHLTGANVHVKAVYPSASSVARTAHRPRAAHFPLLQDCGHPERRRSAASFNTTFPIVERVRLLIGRSRRPTKGNAYWLVSASNSKKSCVRRLVNLSFFAPGVSSSSMRKVSVAKTRLSGDSFLPSSGTSLSPSGFPQ